jgi:hypothetical protein
MRSRLQAVGDPEQIEMSEPDISVPPKPNPVAQAAIAAGLMLALRTLSQRALVALAAMADLMMIASTFILWLLVISNPTTLQLVGVGLYAAFILVAIYGRNR